MGNNKKFEDYSVVNDVSDAAFTISGTIEVKDNEIDGIESSEMEVVNWFSKKDDKYVFIVERSKSLLPVFVNRNVKVGTKGSYGIDVYVGYDVIIDRRRKLVMYDTGLRLQTASSNYMALALPRSSVYKYSNIGYLVNSVGVIDDDYTGKIMFVYRIRFNNIIERIRFWLGDYSFLDIPKRGERLGQIIFVNAIFPVAIITKDEKVKEIAKIKYRQLEREDKGFGSTGK